MKSKLIKIRSVANDFYSFQSNIIKTIIKWQVGYVCLNSYLNGNIHNKEFFYVMKSV